MAGRNITRLVLCALVALFLFYITFPQLYLLEEYLRQTNHFSGQDEIDQEFIETQAELACLRGDWNEDGIISEPIPNVVHFIFGLNNAQSQSSSRHFDFLSYLAIRSAIVSLRPDAVFLHYTYLSGPSSAHPDGDPLTNPWVRRLSQEIHLVHHVPDATNSHYAHISDVLRLKLLQEYGGIYLDIDAFALRPFTQILQSPTPHDTILGYEGGNRWGLCNAVIASRPNSTFVTRWLDSYANANLDREWNYHSVLLPKEMAEKYPTEVCRLPPDAFFWPTWTWRHVAWMHEPIDETEAEYWQQRIEQTNGGLFENQLAYHAWSQMAWDRYLKRLTPTVMKNENTRFNVLMRRFLEDDI